MIIPAVIEDSAAVSLGVVVLPCSQCIDERREADATQQQRNRDEVGQHVHDQRTRSALSETVIDDDDIAKAAMRGVARPATASGTATRL